MAYVAREVFVKSISVPPARHCHLKLNAFSIDALNGLTNPLVIPVQHEKTHRDLPFYEPRSNSLHGSQRKAQRSLGSTIHQGVTTMSTLTPDRSASGQAPSSKGPSEGQEMKTVGKGKGKSSEREVDSEGKPVLPWAFIDCDTDDLVVLIGESHRNISSIRLLALQTSRCEL